MADPFVIHGITTMALPGLRILLVHGVPILPIRVECQLNDRG